MSTLEATDWPKNEPLSVKFIRALLFFIPRANPGYDAKMHLVKKWLIEFIELDGKFVPWREIGLDLNNNIVLAGPDKRNYGFWLDTNMKYEDFSGINITQEEFENYWKLSGVKALEY